MKLTVDCICRTTENPEKRFRYLGVYEGQAKLGSLESGPLALSRISMVPWNRVFAITADQPTQSIPIGNTPPPAPPFVVKDTGLNGPTPGKALNPKQAYGDKKPPLQLIHSIAMLHESAAMHAGKLKYEENNYIDAAVETMTYIGAMLRHIEQYVSGERSDQKEKVHHLGAVRACAGILLTAEACGTLVDNRPVVTGTGVAKNFTPNRVTYGCAVESAFNEVQSTVEHLNRLYPTKA